MTLHSEGILAKLKGIWIKIEKIALKKRNKKLYLKLQKQGQYLLEWKLKSIWILQILKVKKKRKKQKSKNPQKPNQKKKSGVMRKQVQQSKKEEETAQDQEVSTNTVPVTEAGAEAGENEQKGVGKEG